MDQRLTTIGFDADDTLWQNERFFRAAEARFAELLADHVPPGTPAGQLIDRLTAAEGRNIRRYGYGIKGFTLSMVETAIEVTEARVPASALRRVIELGQEMLSHPVELLPHARATLDALAGRYRIVLITKGDLLDQERKLALSGLGALFDGVEIVSEKTSATYSGIFARYGAGPGRAMMVGNSMRSDVIPALKAGGWGVFVPHGQTWAHEHAPAPEGDPHFHQLPDLGALPALVEHIETA